MNLKASMVYDEVNDKYVYFDKNGGDATGR